MRDERVIFSSSVDSLYRKVLAPSLTPELVDRLRARGLNLHAPLLAAYPLAVWVDCLEDTARTLHPDQPVEQGRRLMGRRMVEGYAQTLVGGAVLTLARVVGPMRSLERMQHNFRSGNNYTETRLTVLGPTQADLWFNEPEPLEGFVDGVLEEGMLRVGVQGFTLHRTRHSPESATYHLEWADRSA
ncbi:DUF2378 family protein [Corallococcus interemptor]|uniref:DUF2378 family protein n=1 Tax=Corallococcus TaxID=83461 RepID=UPI001CBB2E09|nr:MULTISPECIES: DUF2378 family protein [unclassified Corallococcus]MBZ4334393.1 DUF2378 family protein [Corallococcus sp. AS-1-12]MBZ4372748.1 DUF2378 family protein [Corallococcus sp. AS-1-6]